LSQVIETLLNDNLDGIKAFDANKDGVIDELELTNASNVALNWAEFSLKNQKNWFYYGSGKPVGPMIWKEIEKVNQKYPEMYLSYSQDGSVEEINFWLPTKLITEIRSILD
tara:strand:+ start:576 stop:908 length:333 start_codon:yes stop_codon:yes gene_type:complete